MNVGVPAVSYSNFENYFRPFVLFGQGNPPQQEEQKTVRIFKFPSDSCTEKPVPSYARRPSPYERMDKEGMTKPIKVVKSVVTTVEIDKPVQFWDEKLINQALFVANEEKLPREERQCDDDHVTTIDVDLSVKSETETNKSDDTATKKP